MAASIYVGFVAVATPVMGLGTPAGADNTLLDITGRAAPVLALPLVLSAVLSQFSAGIAAIALAATVPTYTIVAVASRAFAAYYALQAVLALRTSHGSGRKLAYGTLAVLMAAITVLAKPAG